MARLARVRQTGLRSWPLGAGRNRLTRSPSVTRLPHKGYYVKSAAISALCLSPIARRDAGRGAHGAEFFHQHGETAVFQLDGAEQRTRKQRWPAKPDPSGGSIMVTVINADNMPAVLAQLAERQDEPRGTRRPARGAAAAHGHRALHRRAGRDLRGGADGTDGAPVDHRAGLRSGRLSPGGAASPRRRD